MQQITRDQLNTIQKKTRNTIIRTDRSRTAIKEWKNKQKQHCARCQRSDLIGPSE